MTSIIAPHELPITTGWASAAGAIVSARRFDVPMALAVTSPELGTLWVDLPRQRYHWEHALELLPEQPTGIGISTQQLTPGEELFPWADWQSLDPLLWRVGRTAFADGEASWMRRGDRYRLSRWPDLTALPHLPDDIRVLASLGGGQDLTVDDVAGLTGLELAAVRGLMNALSLMGCLDAVAGPVEPPPLVAEATRRAQRDRAAQRGLFGRLRARLAGGDRG